jgi:hypothetical protein
VLQASASLELADSLVYSQHHPTASKLLTLVQHLASVEVVTEKGIEVLLTVSLFKGVVILIVKTVKFLALTSILLMLEVEVPSGSCTVAFIV